jgi:HEAT repeat protein
MRILPFVCALALAAVPLQAPQGDDSKLEALLQSLRTDDDTARLKTLMALADFGPKAEPAIPQLISALESKSEDLRLNAAIVLGKIGVKALPALTKEAANQDSDVRYYAIWAMGLIGPDAKKATPVVVKALGDDQPGVRRKAAFTLGRIDPEARVAMPALLKALEDQNNDVRRAAADALAHFGDKAVPDLIKALDGSPLLRTEALHALGVIGADAKDAVEPVKALFLGKISPNEDFRLNAAVAAAQTLAKIGKASLPALSEGLKSDDSGLRKTAVDAIGQLGTDGVPTLIDATGDKNTDVRRLAVQRLASMRVSDKSVAIAFGYALKDADDQVRSSALQGLQLLGAAAAPALRAGAGPDRANRQSCRACSHRSARRSQRDRPPPGQAGPDADRKKMTLR